MSLRAIAGLALFNVALVGVGAAMLWGLGALRWWTDVVRNAGLAYLVGVASAMMVLTLELVVGVPVSGGTSAVGLAAVILIGVSLGRARGRAVPGLCPPGWRPPQISLFVAILAAGLVAYFGGLFRAARLASVLPEWDGWWFWVPKAELIYFFGKLDPDALAQVPRSSYPPGVPAVDAAAFFAMGRADTTTLHLQYWFYAIGFSAAVAALLAPRVRGTIWVPCLLASLLAPSVVDRITWTYADLPLGYLLAVAGVLLIVWLEERKGWQLAAAMMLLAGVMLIKREGILLAACLVAAAMIVSISDRRGVWPRLLAGAALAFVVPLAWRVWFTVHDLPSDAPTSGYTGVLDNLDRAWPSFDLVLTTVFDPGLWLALPFLAVASIVLALLAHQARVAAFASSYLVLAVVASTWTIWSNDVLPITQDDALNPIVRMTGSSILVLAVLTPLLLERAWEGVDVRPGVPGWGRSALRVVFEPRRAGWAVVGAVALAFPASTVVGYSGMTLPGGFPRFPSDSDCVSPPGSEEPDRLVLAYARAYPEANRMKRQAQSAGLDATQVEQDGCGRLRVFVDAVPASAGPAAIATARRAGFEPGWESEPD